MGICLSGAVAVAVVAVDGVVGLFVWSTRYRCIGCFAILCDVDAGRVSSLRGFWDGIVWPELRGPWCFTAHSIKILNQGW